MRKNKCINFFLAIVTFSLLSSCNGENEPVDTTVSLNPDVPVLPISFEVGFSGQTYKATQVNAVFVNGHIQITAVKGTELETFTIDIDGTTINTYPTNKNIITYKAGASQPLFTSINPANSVADTGEITITSINAVNKRISGYFNFTGYNKSGTVTSTKEFTNGVFANVPYVIN